MTLTAPSEIIAIDRNGEIFLRAICTECGFVGTLYQIAHDVLAVNQANAHDIVVHNETSSVQNTRRDNA